MELLFSFFFPAEFGFCGPGGVVGITGAGYGMGRRGGESKQVSKVPGKYAVSCVGRWPGGRVREAFITALHLARPPR
jgi:hypothetical protein